jgi:2-iminobutanoate/2-iminopropanoate deaminase
MRVFLARPGDFEPMNAAYRPFFAKDPPARATVATVMTDRGALVQVVPVAVKGDRTVVRAGPPASNAPPYSPGLRVGDRVYLSGTIGTGDPGEPRSHTRQSLAALGRVLEAAGLAWRDVTEALVYVTRPQDAVAIAEVVRETLRDARASAAYAQVQLVVPEPLVEIMLTAIRRA